MASIVERALPSVVSIASTRFQQRRRPGGGSFDDPLFRFFFGPGFPRPPGGVERGLGSGVIIDRGIVVTNHHVVEEAQEITVITSDGRELDAEVVGRDPMSDLAVLRLSGDADGIPVATFGDSARLRLGDIVLAIGNPFGVGQTVTMGIVSAKGRADLGIVDHEDFIQTDAAINPGNSGGALINTAGDVVGINTAILSQTGAHMGIGFAMPSNMVQSIVQSLREMGRVVRGWLGVSIQDVDRDLAEALDLKVASGVLIADVTPGSPADRAGLERGDVVVEIDGQETASSGRLRNVIAAAGAGTKVKLAVLRGGERRDLTIELGELPEAPDRSTEAPPPAPGRGHSVNGFDVDELRPATRQRFGIARDVDRGVVITLVSPGSAAALAGLRPGDVVLELDRQRVESVEVFERLWKGRAGDRLLLVNRGGQTLYVVVKGR